MDLLERYLQAVRYFLPRRQQEDILRELREDLSEQMEDREEELGHPLTENEQAEILTRFGNPLLVASRYRTHQFLIGPALFPSYLTTLKAGLGIAALVTVVLALLGAALSDMPGTQLFKLLVAYPGRALLVFAWTTLVFAGLDFFQSKITLPKWDPRSLPPVVRLDHPISRSEALGELIFAAIGLVWLIFLPGRPYLVLGPAAQMLQLTPIWAALYVPIVLRTAMAVVLSAINYFRPYWTPARSIARMVYYVIDLAMLLVLMWAGSWVAARPGATLSSGTSLDRVVHIINVTTHIGLMVTAFMIAAVLVREILVMRSRRKAASPASQAAVRAQK